MISDIDTSNMAVALLSLFAVLAVANAAVLPVLDTRIADGEDVKLGEIPYQVSLQKNYDHFCGGSVLSTKYVLTAAHCLERLNASSIKVVVGTINRMDQRNVHTVSRIIMHEKYVDMHSRRHDIALLKLETSLKFGKNIAAVALPEEDEVVPAMTRAVVSGWGSSWGHGPISRTLEKADVQIMDQTVCEDEYKPRYIYDSNICANDPSTTKGACDDDDGGPLVVDGKIVGVVSWTMMCGRSDNPTVFTRVASYVSWINRKAV